MGEDIWQEPVRGGVLPPHLLGRPGVEQLRAFLSGEAPVPPIGYLTGLYPTEFGVGSATFVMPVTGWLNITTGLMTAGGVAILADAPLGCAVQTVLPPVTGNHGGAFDQPRAPGPSAGTPGGAGPARARGASPGAVGGARHS